MPLQSIVRFYLGCVSPSFGPMAQMAERRGKIIADRGYNMRNYVRGSGGGPRALESVEWDPKSPNLSSASRRTDD